MTTTRREFCQRTGAMLLAGAAFATLPFAAGPASAQDASVVELGVPGPMGDMVLGDEKAPVTIYEYASMTCSHCAHFQTTTFPELKKRYIDTGKVRYILREFPLDPVAAAAFMLARCSAQEDAGKKDANRYYAVVDALFESQQTWAFVQNPKDVLPNLQKVAKQIGFTDQSFDACLKNQPVLDSIEKVRRHAVDVLKVNSTPTFFINGKRQAGDLPIDELSKIIDPMLKS
ncbi:MAG TPA: DsbA family protein [Pseudolabrys sp.]|nr:DsbA family protein [Pseudolabrys sp.]